MKTLIIMIILLSGLLFAGGGRGFGSEEKVAEKATTEKETGYTYKKPFSPLGASALNFVLGYGIGSFVQGDVKAGVVAVIVDSLSLGVFSIGYARARNEGTTIRTDFLAATLTIAIISKIVMAIIPYVYHKKTYLSFNVLPEFEGNKVSGVGFGLRVSRVF